MSNTLKKGRELVDKAARKTVQVVTKNGEIQNAGDAVFYAGISGLAAGASIVAQTAATIPYGGKAPPMVVRYKIAKAISDAKEDVWKGYKRSSEK